MFKIALLGIFLQVVLEIRITEASSCEEMRIGIQNRTLAHSLLCSKYDGYLSSCCSIIKHDLFLHKIDYQRRCKDGNIFISFYYIFHTVTRNCMVSVWAASASQIL